MSAMKRLITGGLILFGAAAIWHAGATIGYAPASGMGTSVSAPESEAGVRPAVASIGRSGDEVRDQRESRERRSAARRGLIDEELRQQYRSGRMGERPTPATRLTPEVIDTVLTIAEKLDPEMASELRVTCDDDPREFERIMYTSGRRLLSLAELKQNEPDLYDFKFDELQTEVRIAHKTEELRQAYREGDGARVEQMKSDLNSLLSNRVVHVIFNRGRYINRMQERMEEHLAQLRKELNEMVPNTDRLVAEELDAIMDAVRAGDDLGADRDPLGTLNN